MSSDSMRVQLEQLAKLSSSQIEPSQSAIPIATTVMSFLSCYLL